MTPRLYGQAPAATSQLWYYGSGTEPKGPFSKEQIAALVQTGTIGDRTLVWTIGMASWVPFAQSALAREVGAFSGRGVPPPLLPRGGPGPQPAIGFSEAINACFLKYATFSGRAGRPEFWYFHLFVALGLAAAVMVDRFALHDPRPRFISGIFLLAVFLPILAVGTRRLHDTDRSGWWWLASLFPFGGLLLLILHTQPGTKGPNRFG